MLYNIPMDDSMLTFEPLGRKSFSMYQLKDGFRFGTDTVLLAWYTASFVKPGNEAKLLELGSNCGAATLLVTARRDNVVTDALEIECDAYEVLKKNIELNNLSERVCAYNGDVRELPEEIRKKQYDVVFMNPPFYNDDNGPASTKIGRYEHHGGL